MGYEFFTLNFIITDDEKTLPINNNIPDSFTVPPRSESIIPISKDFAVDSVALNGRIQANIFLASSIIPAHEYKNIRIRNRNTKFKI